MFLTLELVGYTSIAILNSTMTLMIDLIKDQSSGVIACVSPSPLPALSVHLRNYILTYQDESRSVLLSCYACSTY